MKRTYTSRKSLTERKRLRGHKDGAVARGCEAREWTPESFARAIARRGLEIPPRKRLMSLRLDSDVIDWFKAQGAGYQSRMNALLRAFMDAHV